VRLKTNDFFQENKFAEFLNLLNFCPANLFSWKQNDFNPPFGSNLPCSVFFFSCLVVEDDTILIGFNNGFVMHYSLEAGLFAPKATWPVVARISQSSPHSRVLPFEQF